MLQVTSEISAHPRDSSRIKGLRVRNLPPLKREKGHERAREVARAHMIISSHAANMRVSDESLTVWKLDSCNNASDHAMPMVRWGARPALVNPSL